MDILQNQLELAINNLKDNIFYNSVKGYYTYLEYYPKLDKTKNYKKNCLKLHIDLFNNNEIDYIMDKLQYVIINYVNEKFYITKLTQKDKNTIEYKFYYKN